MPVIQRLKDRRCQYLGRSLRPVKSKASALRPKTKAEAQRIINSLPRPDREGWQIVSEYGPALVDGGYRY